MAVPVIVTLSETVGDSAGLDLVSIIGTDFGESVEVEFGGSLAEVYRVRPASGADRAIDVFTPYHAPGLVDVTVRNLDGNGDPIAGEEVTEADAYTFQRYSLVVEDNLANLVRTLRRDLARAILANTAYTVSVDWDYQSPDEQSTEQTVVEVAAAPSLTITGPEFDEARESNTNEVREVAVIGPTGPEIRLIREPYVADLVFGLVGVAKGSVQLLNLTQAVVKYFHRNKWVTILRDPSDEGQGSVSFEVDAVQTYRARLSGRKDDLRVFTWSFRVRGFWLDGEARPVDQTVVVLTEEVDTTPL